MITIGRAAAAAAILALIFSAFAIARPALATNGNNGTLKVHEAGTPSGTESNDPKVCEFNFEGFGFDAAQDGYIVIDGQGETDAPAALTLAFGPADGDGFYATDYINSSGGTLNLADGHYKATLYGKDTGQQGPDLSDEKAKSKVFKVECGTGGDDGGGDDGDDGGNEGGNGEGCPSPTTLLVTFTSNGSAFAPNGGNAMGVNVTGDTDMAFWTSAQVVSALVITAGGVSFNVALDFPETVGSVSPHNYAVFGGEPMDALAFCIGDKTNPDTTTHGPSIELSKTAECATVGNDGMATVAGTITVELDSRVLSARVTSALDTILAPGNAAMSRTPIADLVGVVVTPIDRVASVDYQITFDPADIASFDNFIEVTIEDADTGEDRQKIYNDRAAFELCDEGEQPASGGITIIKDAVPNSSQDFAFTTTGAGLSAFSLDDDSDPAVSNQRTYSGLAAGTYTIVESSTTGWTLTALTCSSGGVANLAMRTATVTLAAGAHVTCTFTNTQEGGGTQPNNGGPTTTPRSGTEAGNPLPNTAIPFLPTGSAPASLLAVLMLLALGAGGARAVSVRAQRRR
jgi:hypothetical protein